MVEKVQSSIAVGMQNGASTLESSVEIPEKTGKDPPFDPAIPLLGLYTKDLKSAYYSDATTPIVHSCSIHNS